MELKTHYLYLQLSHYRSREALQRQSTHFYRISAKWKLQAGFPPLERWSWSSLSFCWLVTGQMELWEGWSQGLQVICTLPTGNSSFPSSLLPLPPVGDYSIGIFCFYLSAKIHLPPAQAGNSRKLKGTYWCHLFLEGLSTLFHLTWGQSSNGTVKERIFIL